MSLFSDIANKYLGSKDKGTKLESIEKVIDQPPDERKLVEHVRSKIEMVRATNSRITIEGIYLTNVAYLMGFDGVYYDTTQRVFKNIDPKRRVGRNRFRVNKILPLIQNRLSRLTQSAPKYDVRPNSNTTEDKDACRLGLQIIEDVFDKQKFEAKRQDLLMTTMQGGHGYIQTLWDPCLGKPMIDPVTGELSGYEGDVRLEVLNCLEVFPDPLAKNLEDCQWIIKAKVRKLEYFRERYPERGIAVKQEDAWLLSSIYDMRANALTSVGITGANTQDQMRDSAIELVYYEKRSKDFPNGRMVVCGNGVLLEDKELPIGQYDIVKFDDILIGGRYNSEATITHLRPVQDQYNITRTRMAEFVRRLMGGKFLVAKGSNLTQESINNDVSEVVEFTPVPNAPPPTAMQMPQMPPYAYKDLDTLDKELDYISGINEVSRGVLPSASIPASGIAFLQEQDQTRIGVQTSRNEMGYSKVGENILRYVGNNYEMPRLLKLAGEGLGYTVKEFMGKDLRDNFDVIVIPGSTLPNSKVLKRQDILNAFQMGLLGNPQDDKLKAKVLGMLEYGDVAEIWKEQALKEAQVKKAIDLVEQGQLPSVDPDFDDHAFHLVKLNEYRLEEKFEKLDDQKKQILLHLMELHLKALTNLANPGLQEQQLMAQHMIKQAPQVASNQLDHLQQSHPGAPGAGPSPEPVPGIPQPQGA